MYTPGTNTCIVGIEREWAMNLSKGAVMHLVVALIQALLLAVILRGFRFSLLHSFLIPTPNSQRIGPIRIFGDDRDTVMTSHSRGNSPVALSPTSPLSLSMQSKGSEILRREHQSHAMLLRVQQGHSPARVLEVRGGSRRCHSLQRD